MNEIDLNALFEETLMEVLAEHEVKCNGNVRCLICGKVLKDPKQILAQLPVCDECVSGADED